MNPLIFWALPSLVTLLIFLTVDDEQGGREFFWAYALISLIYPIGVLVIIVEFAGTVVKALTKERKWFFSK